MSYDQEDTLATLKMRALEELDLGSYRCEVNYKGTVYTSENIVLDLRTKPEVLPVESTVTAVLGMEATLSVIVKADPPATPDQITWNTLRISWDNDRFLVDEEKTTLVIKNVSRSDGEGYFSCEVRTDYANDRAYIRVVVVELPKITTSNAPITLFASRVLTCKATGDPDPDVSWFFPNGTQVVGEELEVEEAGNYKCEATNSAGKDTKMFPVLLGELPEISGLQTQHYIKEVGESLDITCSAQGTPTPEISWQFKETDIGNKEQLKVDAVSESDLGVYTCTAINSGGQDTATVTVALAERPVVTLSKDSLNVSLQESIKIVCSAESQPAASLKWVFGGEIVSTTGTLQIDNVGKSNSGDYFCVAENDFFKTEGKFCLFVFETPKVKLNVVNSTVRRGEKVDIKCEATGIPVPEISWFKGAEEITDSATNAITDGRATSTITLASVTLEDAGNFRCVAKNDFGSDSNNVNIVVQSEPFWVEAFDTNSLNVTSGTVISISCKIDGNPAPNPTVYLTKINSVSRDQLLPGPGVEEVDLDKAQVFPEHTQDNVFSLLTNKSIESAVILCRGVNEFGTLSATKILYVHEPFHIRENYTLEQSVHIETKDYKLNCPIEGHPSPTTTTWKLPSNTTVTLTGQEPLIIETFGFSDEGEYTCTVRNDWGMTKTTSLLLSVEYDRPNVTLDYKDVPVGHVGIITCIGHGMPAVDLTLYRREVEVLNVTTHIKSDSSLGDYVVLTYTYLMIPDLVGDWSCKAVNVLGDIDQKDLTLKYYREASVQLSPPVERNSRYNETEPTDIFCNYTGVPTPAVTILINGLNSTSGSNSPGILVHNLGDGSYQIRVKNSQLGTTRIECSAENIWGSDKKTTNVVNTYSLSCYKCITQVCASSNADISIAHIIAVYPEPRYVLWNVTTTSADVLASFQNNSIQIDPGFVEYEAFIKSITSDTKSVQFEIADSRGGKPLQVHTDLEIYEPISAVLIAPTTSLRPGDNVTITASVTAQPLPRLKWFLNEQEISSSSDNAVVGESRLTLVHVTGGAKHVVTLELVPLSSCHTARTQSVVVTVLGDRPPRIYDMPPLIEKNEGEKLDLVCRAAGDPEPTVSWYKRSSTHSELRFSAVKEVLLRVEAMSVEDVGTWECRATNNAGQTDVRFLELVLSATSSGSLGSKSTPEVILSSVLTVVFVVLVGPLLLAVYCLKRRDQRRFKVVTPVSDGGFVERISLEKEIRKLMTPEFFNNSAIDTVDEKCEQESVSPDNPALFVNPDTSNRLPPLPRRCNSAKTVRSREGENSRVQSASPSCCTPGNETNSYTPETEDRKFSTIAQRGSDLLDPALTMSVRTYTASQD